MYSCFEYLKCYTCALLFHIEYSNTSSITLSTASFVTCNHRLGILQTEMFIPSVVMWSCFIFVDKKQPRNSRKFEPLKIKYPYSNRWILLITASCMFSFSVRLYIRHMHIQLAIGVLSTAEALWNQELEVSHKEKLMRLTKNTDFVPHAALPRVMAVGTLWFS